METVRRLRADRRAGRTAALTAYLLPVQRSAVIELLLAVDRLVRANDVLVQAVRERLGSAAAHAVDRSAVADIVGVFSEHVTLVDERIEGDRAVVTYQVADRVPLQQVTLVRREGRWRVRVDEPIEGLPDALRDLADVLVDIAEDLARRDWPETRLREELRRREEPVLRRIAALTGSNR